MKKIFKFLHELNEFLNGDHFYKSYVLNHKKSCSNNILTKKKFLQIRQLEKFKKINRCC